VAVASVPAPRQNAVAATDAVNRAPTVKGLALSLHPLVGVALIADGLHVLIPREYVYFAIAFSAGVEALNRIVAPTKARRRARRVEGE